MAEITVEQLARVVGTPVDLLLAQMKAAGLSHDTGNDVVSDDDKLTLLQYIKSLHSGESGNVDAITEEVRQVALKRKSTQQTLKVLDSSGKKKIVNVEVRKKRTVVAPSTNAVKSKEKRSKKDEQQPVVDHQEKTGSYKKKSAQNSGDTTGQNNTVKRTKKSAVSTPQPPTAPIHDVTENRGDRGRRSSSRRKNNNNRDSYREEDGDVKSWRKRKGEQSSGSSRNIKSKALEQGFNMPTAPIVREVSIPETITVGELAQKMAIKAADVVKFMFSLGTMVTINQVIDQDTAVVVVEEMGHKPKLLKSDAIEDTLVDEHETVVNAVPRAPVVTVMGHVDHGKTSLLDYIRKSRVQVGEAGGITQHIGAYHVNTSKGMISFLDTPGHAAFTAMRARGSKVTDIVVLVVAADDGVMPQTEEAVQHARAAEVPLIVAVNKVDKEEADIERVKNELSHHEVIPEDWGGNVQFIPISALTGQGIDALLEAILLEAEILELKAPAEGYAKGIVIESRLDKGRGPVATVLVQSGRLCKGDTVLVGQQYGRVRAMLDETGATISEAGPSIPAEILGLDGAPNAGDEVIAVQDERKAREIALFRQGKFRDVKLARQQVSNLENIFKNMDSADKRTLKIVLKADVRGSLEAITSALQDLGNEEVNVQVISFGLGGITETDANLALASQAILIGFNVRADASARRIAESEELDLRYYSVIYDLISDVEQALTGMLKAKFREEILGIAEVRDVFKAPKIGAIAGCMVVEGTVYRSERIRVLRDHVIIYEGELESLRRFKDDVSEVRNGMECGIGVKNYNDIKVGDKIEVYKTVQVERSL